jgi:hypothetical protein
MRRVSPVIGWIEIDAAVPELLPSEPVAELTQVLVANLAELTRELDIEWRLLLDRTQRRRPKFARVAGPAGLR